MRFISLNLDISEIQALRHAVAAYLTENGPTEAQEEPDDPVRSRLRITLAELDSVLNRPSPRRLAISDSFDDSPSTPEPHLRLIHSVNAGTAVPRMRQE